MIAFDIFYCIIILSIIVIIIYLYVKLKQPVINLINGIKSVYELLGKFGLIKQDLDNAIKQINVVRRDIDSIKSRVNEINEAIIITKINSKKNVAKTKSNKQ
jgi:predicted RNA-binding protein with PUA domain